MPTILHWLYFEALQNDNDDIANGVINVVSFSPLIVS